MKTILYILLLFCTSLLSCKRDADELTRLGPEFVTVEKEFSISSFPADLTAGNVNFTGMLTASSLWKIEVRGLNSGAVKRFTGTSQFIDISNAEWDGSSDTSLAFKTEPCAATLYLPTSKVTKKIYFDIVVDNGPLAITHGLAISAAPVNFGTQVYFTASMNKFRGWVITITGNTSGATKVITGSSKVLSASNTVWDGSSENPFFFRTETCQAVLSFPDTTLTQSISFAISVPKTHPGYLIDDFESANFGSYLGSSNGTYFDGPDQATSTIDLYTFSPSPQGNKVGRFDCNDVNSSYYTGGIYHNSAGSAYTIPAMSSDSLYLNLFIYGYSGGNAALSIEVRENDGDGWSPAQIAVNWTGWKLVSVKYGQMSNNKSTGNMTKETNKINAINVSMNSIPQGLNCRALIDYLMFSVGKPLVP